MRTVSSSDIFANVGNSDEERLIVDSQTQQPSLILVSQLHHIKFFSSQKIHSHIFFLLLSWNYGWNFLEDIVFAGDEELAHQDLDVLCVYKL